ncbi:MAG: SUMF1/EgtB/PvdO family nonheme iron enzyme [Marinifilaceae bacterium]
MKKRQTLTFILLLLCSPLLGQQMQWIDPVLETGDIAQIDKAFKRKISEISNSDYYMKSYAEATRLGIEKTDLTLLKTLAQNIEQTIGIEAELRFFDPVAVQLAYKDMVTNLGYKENCAWVETLPLAYAELQQRLYNGDVSVIHELRGLKDKSAQMLLNNPFLRGNEIMYTRRNVGDKAKTAMSGGLGVSPSNFQNNSEIWNAARGWDNEFVGVSLMDGGEVSERIVFKPEKGKIISDPEVHFDGKRVLFSSIGTNNRWHLFELDLSAGTIVQVTPEEYKDFDSFDGCYTPDGRYVFCSTGTFLGLPCTNGGNKMCGLFIYDPKTGKTRQLTYDQDSNWDPIIMNNGQVMYQRWEYADLPHSNSRIMFRMNPDGTTQQSLYGTNSYFPTALFSARPLPGESTAFVGVVSGHHSVSRSGRLMVFDPMVGNKEADGVIAEIPYRGRKVEPIVRDRLPDGVWPQFLHPYPLNDKYFLVAMKQTPNSLWGIYLVDVFNNVTLIAEKEGSVLLEPQLLVARPTPPTIPDRVKMGEKDATIYLQDVYFGGGLKDIPHGTVKKLRIGSYHFSPVTQGGLLGAIGMDGPWDIKRILGTVDVEEDGSVMFKVPANVPIFVQPLDAEGKALQVMRSWFTAMPGETLSCLGCHEDTRSIPQPKVRMASKKAPQQIKEWFGKERGFSFAHEIQPIIDMKCVGCHNADNSSIPYLKGDVMETEWMSHIGGRAGKDHGGHFTTSYVNLHRYVRRPGIESDMNMLVPMDVHADQTELMRMLNKGHHGVKLTTEEVERIACWIDFNAPYHGSRTTIPNYDKSAKWRELKEAYAEMLGAPTVDYHYLPQVKEVGEPIIPEEKLSKEGVKKLKGWPLTNQNEPRKTKSVTVDNKYNLQLVEIPKGQFIMGSGDNADEMPRNAVKINKPFWMAQFEVTNELYALFDATHDSRHEHRHGYQFGRIGYPLNAPQQPVVRVSWDDAMAFCEWLSTKTGMKFSLPTEAQWEWACRAGTDGPYYFGNKGDDFSKYANMGDIMLKDFAACTSHNYYEGVRILPNPNRFDDWIPRDTTYNDGGFVSETVGSYLPNSWGLYDMLGNVAEWTRSDYAPYPYRMNNKNAEALKVTRGGSWYDRPAKATASYRQPYRSYQKVYNVGFRVVLEE